MMIKKFTFKIELYTNRIRKSTNPKDFAAIHATVLSIMVGVFSAYFLYTNGVINTKKFDAMSVAENINEIEFGRWFYFPDDENIVYASDSSDIDKLIQNIVALSLLSSSTPGDSDIAGIKIPTDPVERAEKIVGIMNVIAHRYPFPRALDNLTGGHSQFRAEPIIFTDFEQLWQWFDDLDRVIKSLKSVTSLMPIYFPEYLNSNLQALFLKEKENITKAEGDLTLQIQGERNPYIIAKSFISKMYEVENIYYATSVEINRVKELQNVLAPKYLVFLVLLSGFLVFVVGVLLPLTSFRLNPMLYIHLPLLYYSIIYMIAIVYFAVN